MERDFFLYKIRRQIQVIAYHILPNTMLAKFYSRIILKQNVNLEHPQTFNEKIQWLKLHEFPNNPRVVECADKYKVREYVQMQGLGDTLVPLLGAWERAKDIDWNILPNQFVLKCNHGCAYNILCSDKRTFDKDKAVSQLNKWMQENFGAFNIELHYSQIKPRMIICEEYLGAQITDYKFFCFNGEPKYLYVSNDLVHDRKAKIGFFYLDGRKMPMIRDDYSPMEIDKLPDFFEDMKNAAAILCKDFKFVRVDFFIAKNRYYFAELTFTPSAGMMPFNPVEFDLEWGKILNIKNSKRV
jgi:hypothetical protein